ncbi:MAG: SGNH/GDSL hydrolase family protein [Alkalinema sp. RL_2_19]|nr:SGNH/GDSL hydrolase family protein [Alkalinema sp. RL_2_19]
MRSTADLPITKPKNEVRILVIGGSTAFGSLASENSKTFAQQLENRLNQQVKDQQANPGKFRPTVLPYFADEMQKAMQLSPAIRAAQYRVINAAVPGYLTSNTLADLTTRLQQYQPNMVVLMNGYSDLLTPADRIATDLATDQLAAHPVRHLWGSLREGVQGLFNQLYLTKTLRYWILKPEPELEQLVNPLEQSGKSLPEQLSQDDKELTQRVDRYQTNLQQIANLTNSSKIPFIVALTPELHQRNADNQSAAEKQRLKALGKTYEERIQTGYKALDQAVKTVKRKRSNLIVVPLSQTLNQAEGEVFQDTIHLTDEAQTAISDRLYQTIAPMLLVKSKPFGS